MYAHHQVQQIPLVMVVAGRWFPEGEGNSYEALETGLRKKKKK